WAVDTESLSCHGNELDAVRSALAPAGELDLWSCAVAAGPVGESLVHDIAAATGARVAASTCPIGAQALGGTWQLDFRVGGACGEVPFATSSLANYCHVLGPWSAAGVMTTARTDQTATFLPNGKVLVTGGLTSTGSGSLGYLASAELYDPTANTWSPAGSMAWA